MKKTYVENYKNRIINQQNEKVAYAVRRLSNWRSAAIASRVVALLLRTVIAIARSTQSVAQARLDTYDKHTRKVYGRAQHAERCSGPARHNYDKHKKGV